MGIPAHKIKDHQLSLLAKKVEKLTNEIGQHTLVEYRASSSEDPTFKILARLVKDDRFVEAVHVPFHQRDTICLSTQIGCAMGCHFCATATQGLKRNLSAEEIVSLYLLVIKESLALQKAKGPMPNIVFMGQGEPLHNFAEVKRAVELLLAKVGLGPRQITLSTVGLVKEIPRLKELPQINIALSLHSPFQLQRQQIMPIAKANPLSDILQALDQLPLRTRQFINFEYLLVHNFNMGQEHADELERLLGPDSPFARKAIINLIPFNECAEVTPYFPYVRPLEEEIKIFKSLLLAKKLRVMLRTSKGRDIMAACGQLLNAKCS